MRLVKRLFVSRYLVKCPLSLDRLEILDDESVSYCAKDNREGDKPETWSLSFEPKCTFFLTAISNYYPNFSLVWVNPNQGAMH